MSTGLQIGSVYDDATHKPIMFSIHVSEIIGPGYRMWGELQSDSETITIHQQQIMGSFSAEQVSAMAERIAADALRKHRVAQGR